jgi:hypothetical protein
MKKSNPFGVACFLKKAFFYTQRSIFPVLKQRVQTYFFCGVPFSITVTRLTFGAHFRFVFLCEWLTLFPDIMPLLQISQNFAICFTSLEGL